jgi:hypothetical protein
VKKKQYDPVALQNAYKALQEEGIKQLYSKLIHKLFGKIKLLGREIKNI